MEFCTNLEQSKILGRILPLSSADMGWNLFVDDTKRVLPIDDWALTKDGSGGVKFYHAWSLTALLNVLPNNEPIETTISRGSWKIDPVEYLPNIWWCEYEDTKNQTEFNISADNPVDACVEMILRLHELNLL